MNGVTFAGLFSPFVITPWNNTHAPIGWWDGDLLELTGGVGDAARTTRVRADARDMAALADDRSATAQADEPRLCGVDPDHRGSAVAVDARLTLAPESL